MIVQCVGCLEVSIWNIWNHESLFLCADMSGGRINFLHCPQISVRSTLFIKPNITNPIIPSEGEPLCPQTLDPHKEKPFSSDKNVRKLQKSSSMVTGLHSVFCPSETRHPGGAPEKPEGFCREAEPPQQETGLDQRHHLLQGDPDHPPVCLVFGSFSHVISHLFTDEISPQSPKQQLMSLTHIFFSFCFDSFVIVWLFSL